MSDPQNGARGETLLTSVTEIVSVYLRQNRAEPEQLSQIITSVTEALRGALSDLPGAAATAPQSAVVTDGAQGEETATAEAQEQASAAPAEPAVPVEQSVHTDYLVCLECGLRQKLLKKHLRVAHGLSPQDYRKRWALDTHYPMAAPSFAEGKREMAKRIGLGRSRAPGAVAEPEPPEVVVPPSEPARKGRGRKAAVAAAGQNGAGTGRRTGRGRKPKVAGLPPAGMA